MKFSFKRPVLIVAIVGTSLLGTLIIFAVIFKSPQPSALSPVNEHAVSTASAGNNGTKKPEVIAWDLCLQFPRAHREQCVIGAIDNLLNFDEVEVSRAKMFCNTVDSAYRKICYQRVGYSLKNHSTDTAVVRGKCVTLEDANAAASFQGPAGNAIKHCGHYSETSNSRKRKRNGR